MTLTFAIAATMHFGMEGDYNERHPSVRFQHDYFIAGAYLNSEGNVSPYLGGRWEHRQFYLEAGAVFGYEYADIAPYVRAGYDVNDSFGVFVAPAYEIWDGDVKLGMVAGVEFTFR